MNQTCDVVRTGRIEVLDVLRGMALFGMIVVHFLHSSFVKPNSAVGNFVSSVVTLLVEDKAYTTFAILFGAGFALQLRHAQAHGQRIASLYTRRLLGIAMFGLVAQGIFGFNVLLDYAKWGLLLLLVWRWSTRTLVMLVVFCTMSQALFSVAAGSYQWATLGVEGSRQANIRRRAAYTEAVAARRQGEQQRSFRTVIAARLRFITPYHTVLFNTLPWSSFVLFLLGLLGLRCGVWEDPLAHRRLILGSMAFGLIAWALATWVLPLPWPALPVDGVGAPIRDGFQLLRRQWLALTYIGGVLLLFAGDQSWVQRLRMFGLTGRMALTNYMMHVMLLDVLFRPYGFHLGPLPAEFAPVAGLAMFGAFSAFSWWWLQHFRQGPAEWMLRSITYARLDSIRIPRTAPQLVGVV